MLGAKDVAFPRLNLLSWYIYVFGSIFGVLSIIQGGVDTGWTFYTPYSTTTDADHWRVFFMILAAFILGFSSILTGLNFIVTTHKLRAPGMGWFDMPLFIWALYATSIIQVLATPGHRHHAAPAHLRARLPHRHLRPGPGRRPGALPALLLVLLAPRGVRDDPARHGHHLRAALGARRKPIFGYRAIAFSSIGIAAVSLPRVGHHMFTAMGELVATLFSALTFLVAIPTAVKVFNWIATLYKGSIALNTPMLYALGFLFLFSIGGLTGLPLGALATDLHLHDSYFVVAHFHYVMMGGTVIALVGGIHHWWPKMFGQDVQRDLGHHRLPDRLRRVQHHLLHPVLPGHPGHAPPVRDLRRRVPVPAHRLDRRVVAPAAGLPRSTCSTSSTRWSPAPRRRPTPGAG
jgi:cytochrome c oxidase subunit 1